MIANSNGARVNIGYSYFASADVNMWTICFYYDLRVPVFAKLFQMKELGADQLVNEVAKM